MTYVVKFANMEFFFNHHNAVVYRYVMHYLHGKRKILTLAIVKLPT